MVRPGRPMQHVHNWQICFRKFGPFEQIKADSWGNNAGAYAYRYWDCVRGGKVKHTSPSATYPVPIGLFGRNKTSDFDEDDPARYPGVIIRASGIFDFDEKV